jgi:hypothetical protein
VRPGQASLLNHFGRQTARRPPLSSFFRYRRFRGAEVTDAGTQRALRSWISMKNIGNLAPEQLLVKCPQCGAWPMAMLTLSILSA